MKRLALIALLLLAAGLLVWLWHAQTTPGGQVSSARVQDQRDREEEPDEDAPPELPGPLAGVVTDADGRAVAGALVTLADGALHGIAEEACAVCGRALLDCEDPTTPPLLLARLRHAAKTPATNRTTRSDAAGAFVFTDVPPGEVLLLARAGGRTGSALSAEREGVELVVAAAAVTDVRVVDEEQQPVAGASVTGIWRRTLAIVEESSDGDGRVHIAKSDDDYLWLWVRAPGFVPRVTALSSADGDGTEIEVYKERTLVVETRSAGRPVDALVHIGRDGVQHDVSLRTHDGQGRIPGFGRDDVTVSATTDALVSESVRVTLDEADTHVVLELRVAAWLLVEVHDDTGQLVGEADVTLVAADTSQSERTGEDGTAARFGPIAEAAYTLEAAKAGFRSAHLALDLKPGENRRTLVLRPSQRIVGTVRDGAGAPVGGAAVALAGENEVTPTISDAETGAFELFVDEAGPYVVEAEHEEHGRAAASVQAPADGVALTLVPSSHLRVMVQGPDGPIDHAMLWVSPGHGSSTHASTGPDGVADFVCLDPGIVTLHVASSGLRDVILEGVNVASAGKNELTVRLDAGVSISGRVQDDAGKPIQNAQAVILNVAHASAGPDGEFVLKALDPKGAFELVVEAEEYLPAAPLQVTGDTHDLVVTLHASPRLTGRVLATSGKPIAVFRVGNSDVQADDGRFDVAFQPAKEGELLVGAEGFLGKTLTPPAKGGAVGDVVLTPAPSIHGVVVDAAGAPVGSATVGCEGCSAEVVTGADGAFLLSVATPGDGVRIYAARGQQRGNIAIYGGGDYARIVLRAPTHVHGQTIGAVGVTIRETPGVIWPRSDALAALRSDSAVTLRVDADTAGAFDVDLAEGVWLFSTRASAGGQAVDVSGESMQVTVGASPGSCEVAIGAPEGVDQVWLVPVAHVIPPGAFNAVAGAVALADPGATRRPWRARGVVCGEQQVLLVAGEARFVQSLVVVPPLTETVVTPPPGAFAVSGTAD